MFNLLEKEYTAARRPHTSATCMKRILRRCEIKRIAPSAVVVVFPKVHVRRKFLQISLLVGQRIARCLFTARYQLLLNDYSLPRKSRGSASYNSSSSLATLIFFQNSRYTRLHGCSKNQENRFQTTSTWKDFYSSFTE